MKVLLSIKPEFAEKIFNGEKQFEFRRAIFKNDTIEKAVIYVSSPICKVMGEFEIGEILHDKIDSLWNKTSKHAGISKAGFLDYFSDKDSGFAIKIKNVTQFDSPKCIRKDYNVVPPQSFLYLK